MPQTQEFTAVVAGSPQLLFGAAKNHHEWVPHVIPTVYKSGERQEGDGVDGSVCHYDIHEDSHDAHGGKPKVKVVVDEYNESTLYYLSSIREVPRYGDIKYHLTFLPGPSADTTTLKWLIDYGPPSGDAPPLDDFFIRLPEDAYKDLAAHLESAKSGKQSQQQGSVISAASD